MKIDIKKYIYNDIPSKEDINNLSSLLRSNKDSFITLYHGTSVKHKVTEQGLLRTTARRRNSYQSESGYVYLSLFPSSARLFGELAYPHDKVCVYAVNIRIGELKADKDQLRNKRIFSKIDIGNTLAESFVYGHGARVRRNVFPYELKLTNF